MSTKYRFDCLKFKGYKPCAPKKICSTCDEYQPWSKKIVIVKLGALGDVLRTTPVLLAFKRKHPNAQITWVTKKNAKEMLETNPHIHRLVYVDEPDNGGTLRLLAEEFDEMHCYDKEDAAIGLASLIKAPKKFGFHLNAQGQMAPLNQASEYCFDLGLSDPLKFFDNQKSYQEVTYQCSEFDIPTPMDPYDFYLKPADRVKSQGLLKDQSSLVVGLNTGSGKVFKTKQWLEEYFLDLAKLLKKELGATVLLLGGQDEHERNLRLATALGSDAIYPGCNFNIREFAAILEQCNLLVTGDTLAMHLALSVKTPVVVLFGSTCDQEVDVYGMGRKLVARPKCAPCYKNECDQPDWMRCMKDITPRKVFESSKEVLQSIPKK